MRWLFLFLFFSSPLFAGSNYIPTGNLKITGPRDNYYLTGLTEWSSPFSVNVLTCGIFAGDCGNTIYLTPQHSTESSFLDVGNSKTYSVYNIGDPNAFAIYEVKDSGGNNWIPVNGTSRITVFNDGKSYSSLRADVRVKLVVPNTRSLIDPQVFNVSNAVSIGIFTNNITDDEPDYIYLKATTLTISPTTCSINSNVNTINIVNIKDNQFASIGSVSPESSFSLYLNCPTGVTVKASFIDILHPDNMTNILLINESISEAAKGVGIQVMKKTDNIPLYLGVDSVKPGSANQTTLISSNNFIGTQTQNFAVRLIRTGDVTPGVVNAKMGITFSYQ